MYIYKSGAVGEAVRQKIESTKETITNGAERSSTPFSAVVKSMLESVDGMNRSNETEKTAETKSAASAVDSSTLLYMLQNSDNASLTGLLGEYTGKGLRTAAADMQTAAKKLLDGADGESASAFVEKYNALSQALKSSGKSSSLIYLNSLETYVTAQSQALAGIGISTDQGYTLSYNGETSETPDTSALSSLVSSLSTAAMQIYTSAATSDSTSDYYQTLIGSML